MAKKLQNKPLTGWFVGSSKKKLIEEVLYVRVDSNRVAILSQSQMTAKVVPASCIHATPEAAEEAAKGDLSTWIAVRGHTEPFKVWVGLVKCYTEGKVVRYRSIASQRTPKWVSIDSHWINSYKILSVGLSELAVRSEAAAYLQNLLDVEKSILTGDRIAFKQSQAYTQREIKRIEKAKAALVK